MHTLHKAMKMYAQLVTERQAFEKSIYQIGFAPAHSAPKIQPYQRLWHVPAKLSNPGLQAAIMFSLTIQKALVQVL